VKTISFLFCVFSSYVQDCNHGTLAMVQEYIKENGGKPESFSEKSDLISEATRICTKIEQQVIFHDSQDLLST
jgi:hypothetical protein